MVGGGGGRGGGGRRYGALACCLLARCQLTRRQPASAGIDDPGLYSEGSSPTSR